MPTYVFKCKDCKALFDKQGEMKKPPQTAKCPNCAKRCERYYGEMNFVLKGNNWPSKDIKSGKPIGKKSKIEDVMNYRAKKGLNPGKEKPMSEEEFNRRKALNQKWIEQQGK